jgi:hypothetical protein
MERFSKPFNPEKSGERKGIRLSVVMFLICAVVVIAIATIIIEHLISSGLYPPKKKLGIICSF